MKTLLEITKSGMDVAQRGLETTSNNIANVNTEGYSRQRLVTKPLFARNGLFFDGLGVRVTDVEQLRDFRINNAIYQKNQELSYLNVKSNTYSQLEASFITNSGNDLDSRVSTFFSTFGDLAANPASLDIRNKVINDAEQMIDTFNNLHNSISNQRKTIAEDVESLVGIINEKLNDIASLNEQIKQFHVNKRSTNGLIDKQTLKVNELSKLLNLDVHRTEEGQVDLSIKGISIISGTKVHELYLSNDSSSDLINVRLTQGGQGVDLDEGELGAYIELFNNELPELESDLNDFTDAIMNQVNNLHTSGIGRIDSTSRSFFELESTNPNKLIINEEILSDVRNIAAEDPNQVNASGNGLIAQQIADLKDIEFLNGYKPTEFAIQFISEPGTKLHAINNNIELRTSELDLLKSQDQQVSGVNMDEELSKMIQYQQAYQGAAKIMQSAQLMYQSLMSILD